MTKMAEIMTKIITHLFHVFVVLLFIGGFIGGIFNGMWFRINYLMPNNSGKKHATL
jgi:hypothetical protein